MIMKRILGHVKPVPISLSRNILAQWLPLPGLRLLPKDSENVHSAKVLISDRPPHSQSQAQLRRASWANGSLLIPRILVSASLFRYIQPASPCLSLNTFFSSSALDALPLGSVLRALRAIFLYRSLRGIENFFDPQSCQIWTVSRIISRQRCMN